MTDEFLSQLVLIGFLVAMIFLFFKSLKWILRFLILVMVIAGIYGIYMFVAS